MNGDFQLQQVKVRMYRPGLGDCFLLTFQSTTGECRYMLIDCGVLQNTKGQEERLCKIIEDIRKQCRGKLHIVVATHEHEDHLSGFVMHRNKFKTEFEIGQVWLAWTEEKSDPDVAETYAAVRRMPLDVLEEVLQKYEGLPEEKIPEAVKSVKKIYDFISDGGMDSVKSLVHEPTYLHPQPDPEKGPSKVIVRDDFGGVRFHVLGPPENPKALGGSNLPQSKNQIYGGEPVRPATAFAAAVLNRRWGEQAAAASELDIKDLFKMCLPFDVTCQIAMEEARNDAFFIEHYGFEANEGPQGPQWRRIENDWMEAGTELALDLDTHTNNTSLVLAIELSPGGKVLLFPGDAQHGSWLSWANTPAGIDLLKRTVFYKVGHHGSNNATLISGGLDRMISPDLVAMLPVDPVRQPNFHLPDTTRLLPRIQKQAKGRVIQSCEGQTADEPCPCVEFKVPTGKPADMPEDEWGKFLDAISWDRSGETSLDETTDQLWVEYTICR